ncbi:MAG: ABC transporter permease [Clostridiales bacterium]|nr:ABC transporter permease [Clostridiales bacterium]
MKKLLLWFYLTCKRNLKKPAYTIFLIGLPLLMVYISNLGSSQNEGLIQVGIYSDNPDSLTKDIINDLVAIEGAVGFYLYDKKEDLINHIKNGSLECGYEFPENFKERIDRMNYKASINLFTSPSTVASTIINEIIFGAISKTYGSEIATTYVKNNSLFNDYEESAVLFTKKQYEFYSTGGGTFRLTYEYLDKNSNVLLPENNNSVMPIRGILSVLLFVAGLFASVSWLEEKESGSLSALPNYFHKTSKYLTLLATLIPLAVSVLITLKITSTWNGFGKELSALILYLFLILLFCGVLSTFVKNSFTLGSLLPVFSIGSLIFCPIFIDISTLIPMLKVLEKIFLPFYYLVQF